MRVNGQYVGLGEGDVSDEVRKIKDFVVRKWDRFDTRVSAGNLFDHEFALIVGELQGIYNSQGVLATGKYISGVVNLETKYAMGYVKRPARPKPIIFTIEGHMSNMWMGPCAVVASILEQQGVCKWQPIGYDTTALPFNNSSGVSEFTRLLNANKMDDGYPFPDDLNWGLLHFSQGAIVGCKTYLAMRGQNHKRLKTLKRVVAFGNPYRQKDVIAEWIPDPPKAGTQGISDVRMTDTPLDIWREHSRTGDLYAENPDDEVGLNRTAIYKIAAENSWVGGPAGMLGRIIDLIGDPFDGVWDISRAIIGGVMFVGNMDPHGGYELGPCIDWMRGISA